MQQYRSTTSPASRSTGLRTASGLRRIAVAGVVALTPVASTACGGDGTADGSTTTAAGSPTSSVVADGAVHNSIDVAFAQGMIPHHAQAVEMSELAATNTSDPEVQALAAEIIAAQGPEIEQMTAWLTAWGAEVPNPDASMEENMDMAGGMMMSGMISESDLERLRAARDAEFDRLYLELMILHHEGAIEMAQQELDGGDSPEAKALAQRIIDTQQAEITRMEQLLGVSG
jgi:uncharacterized protein (DUF305 family)